MAKKNKKKSDIFYLIADWLRYVFFQEKIFSEERRRFLIEREAYIKKREAELKRRKKK